MGQKEQLTRIRHIKIMCRSDRTAATPIPPAAAGVQYGEAHDGFTSTVHWSWAVLTHGVVMRMQGHLKPSASAQRNESRDTRGNAWDFLAYFAWSKERCMLRWSELPFRVAQPLLPPTSLSPLKLSPPLSFWNPKDNRWRAESKGNGKVAPIELTAIECQPQTKWSNLLPILMLAMIPTTEIIALNVWTQSAVSNNKSASQFKPQKKL